MNPPTVSEPNAASTPPLPRSKRNEAKVRSLGLTSATGLVVGSIVGRASAWQARFSDAHEDRAVADGDRRLRAQLGRRLHQWTPRYPGLDVRSVAVRGTFLDYLAANAGSIQLVVV